MASFFNNPFSRGVWWITETAREVLAGMSKRVDKSTRFLQYRIKQNISRPVVRTAEGVQRSVPGEFPRKDSGDLRASVRVRFTKQGRKVVEGEVFTDMEYASPLETRMNRSFMERTMRESAPILKRMLLKPFTASETLSVSVTRRFR